MRLAAELFLINIVRNHGLHPRPTDHESLTMVALSLNDPVVPVSAYSPDPASMAMVNFLRFVFMKCRSKRRTGLFEACALLQTTRTASQEALGEALARGLSEGLGRPTRLHAPGAAELTFDEKWLVQLAGAITTGDTASETFLLASRVPMPHRRLIRFLVAGVSEHFLTNLE